MTPSLSNSSYLNNVGLGVSLLTALALAWLAPAVLPAAIRNLSFKEWVMVFTLQSTIVLDALAE